MALLVCKDCNAATKFLLPSTDQYRFHSAASKGQAEGRISLCDVKLKLWSFKKQISSRIFGVADLLTKPPGHKWFVMKDCGTY